jgi:hypothetical protein
MVVGTGASLAPTGTGTIQATNIASTISAGTNVTITGSGTTAAPYVLTSTSTASTAFSALTGSTNTTAAMVVGSGASLAPAGTGTIQATSIASTITAGTNVTITGSGTTASPYSIAASGGGGGGGLFGGISAPTLSSTGLSSTYGGSGTFTATDTTYGVSLADTVGTLHVGGRVKAYPGVAYTATGLFSVPAKPVNYQEFGLIIADTLSGKSLVCEATAENATLPLQVGVRAWTNPTTYSSDPQATVGIMTSPYLWLRWKDDGTNITCSYSLDNQFWVQSYTVAKSSSFLGSGGFNYLGIEIDPNGTATGTTLMNWQYSTP